VTARLQIAAHLLTAVQGTHGWTENNEIQLTSKWRLATFRHASSHLSFPTPPLPQHPHTANTNTNTTIDLVRRLQIERPRITMSGTV